MGCKALIADSYNFSRPRLHASVEQPKDCFSSYFIFHDAGAF